MGLIIKNCNAQDLTQIFEFYDHAIELQKKVSPQQWKGFDHDKVQQEVSDDKHYKILVNGQIACIFVISLHDPAIWGERDLSPSIYLHRIVTHPDFKGMQFVQRITNWAIDYARENNLHYVRMDTWADNEKLITYYTKFGYEKAGTIAIDSQSGLPKHYEGITLQLFEIKVD